MSLLKADVLNADVLFSSVIMAGLLKKIINFASFSEDSRINVCSLVDSDVQERAVVR